MEGRVLHTPCNRVQEKRAELVEILQDVHQLVDPCTHGDQRFLRVERHHGLVHPCAVRGVFRRSCILFAPNFFFPSKQKKSVRERLTFASGSDGISTTERHAERKQGEQAGTVVLRIRAGFANYLADRLLQVLRRADEVAQLPWYHTICGTMLPLIDSTAPPHTTPSNVLTATMANIRCNSFSTTTPSPRRHWDTLLTTLYSHLQTTG